jgi:hypothetical protein
MTQSWRRPTSIVDEYTMSWPSGDQAGYTALRLNVRRTNPVPSTLTRYKSPGAPSRFDEKTIRAESGEKLGVVSSTGSVLSESGSLPSAFTTQTPPAENAIRCPLGDQSGDLAL